MKQAAVVNSKENSNELFDTEKVLDLLKNVNSFGDLTKPGGFIQEIIKRTVENLLKAEQEKLLQYPVNQKASTRKANTRNGYSKRILKTTAGEVAIDVPRDRLNQFEPKILKPYQNIDPELERQILALYSRGISVREIESQIHEMYGVEVSPGFISSVTDRILSDVIEWQNRPLDDIYPVIFLDAIHYKIRTDGKVISKAVYSVLGINVEGNVNVLGLWLSENEGAAFWTTVVNDLAKRGVKDILIACIDGLKGFSTAIQTVFPKTEIQLCIVHQVRNSLRLLGSKYHKEFVKDLKKIYNADNVESAELELCELEKKWEKNGKVAIETWRRNWCELSTFFNFNIEIRKMIYTTNLVEALHRQYRKITKTKGSFPTDDSLKKLLYLASKKLSGNFKQKNNWNAILAQLKIYYGDRIIMSK